MAKVMRHVCARGSHNHGGVSSELKGYLSLILVCSLIFPFQWKQLFEIAVTMSLTRRRVAELAGDTEGHR